MASCDSTRGHLGEDLDRALELGRGKGEWEPYVALEQAGGRETRTWCQVHVVRRGLERQAGADRPGQLRPDVRAPRRAARSRQAGRWASSAPASAARRIRITSAARPGSRPGESSVCVATICSNSGLARSMAARAVDQPVDQPPGRREPNPPQAAPHRLAQRADRDRARVAEGGRPAPGIGTPSRLSSDERLVEHGGQPARASARSGAGGSPARPSAVRWGCGSRASGRRAPRPRSV